MKIKITESDMHKMTSRVLKELNEYFEGLPKDRRDALCDGADYEWDDFFTTDVPEAQDEEFNNLVAWCKNKKPELSDDEARKFAGNILYSKKHKFNVYLYDNVPEGATICKVRTLSPDQSGIYAMVEEPDGWAAYQISTDPRRNPGELIRCDKTLPDMPFKTEDELKSAMVARKAKFAKRPTKPVQCTWGPLGSTPDPTTGGRYYMEPGHYYGD